MRVGQRRRSSAAGGGFAADAFFFAGRLKLLPCRCSCSLGVL